MYEFKAETPTQYDFMSRVSPQRFKGKSSHKMDYSCLQIEHPILSSCWPLFPPLLLPWGCSHSPFSPKDNEAWVLMDFYMDVDNQVNWVIISQGYVLFWESKLFFSHLHELGFDCERKGVSCEYRDHPLPFSSLYRAWCTIMPINLLIWSICEIREKLGEMKGWMGRNSNFPLYAWINTSWQVQLLSVLNSSNTSPPVIWYDTRSTRVMQQYCSF